MTRQEKFDRMRRDVSQIMGEADTITMDELLHALKSRWANANRFALRAILPRVGFTVDNDVVHKSKQQ